MTVSVSLGPYFTRMMDYLIQIGRYENRSEVVRAALRHLIHHEYGLGYVPREEEFSVLMASYARLTHFEREKDYPRRVPKHRPIGGKEDDVLASAKEYTQGILDAYVKTHAGSPSARFDADMQPKGAKSSKKHKNP